MSVSVIIPARNAATTLAETLESLRAQTFQDWEAIVVDDGSTDDTAAIAAAFARHDPRIRVTNRPGVGASAARNAGIALARHAWLLFLDADDWLLPTHLQRLTDEARTVPALDAVHCGWARVSPGGIRFDDHIGPRESDLFPVFARTCAFSIHACLVRRSAVDAVGGFDTSLKTCEDWDLWQRIARAGARFGSVDEVLALYRMRPDSASLEIRQLLTDGLTVITRAHCPDPRVPHQRAVHLNGLPTDDLPAKRFYLASWCAGLAIGRDQDARPLLDMLPGDEPAGLAPGWVAVSVFTGVLASTCRPPCAWIDLWSKLQARIDQFLTALEGRSATTELATQTRRALRRLVLERSPASLPVTLDDTYGARQEVTRPIADLVLPASTQRLVCVVEVEGTQMGTLELPVCDGIVPGYVLADAIAAEFSWTILGKFFEQTVYRELHVERDERGSSLRRGALRLAHAPSEDVETFRRGIHDRAGWEVFLQELWARPGWSNADFYSPRTRDKPGVRRWATEGWLVVEVSEELPDVMARADQVEVLVSVGGCALGTLAVPAEDGMIRAQALRTSITSACGLELCIAAVREGLLGQPLNAEPDDLRARLAAAAAARAGEQGAVLDVPPGFVLAPGAANAATRALTPRQRGWLLGNRAQGQIRTTASRRVAFPAGAIESLADAASAAGELVARVVGDGGHPERIVYAPDLIWRPARVANTPALVATRRTIVADESHGADKRAERRARGDRWYGAEVIRAVLTRVQRPAAMRKNADRNEVVTDQLPILMYHRIASTGSPLLARHRVTPEAFENQLAYLRAAGYHGVRLEDWRAAREQRKPLSGRAVSITFDDGYVDFLTHAWPLLKRYGFSATVFLVADAIGGSNHWDHALGEDVPLLGWKEIRHLQDEGVEFGSHSASHRPLTTLSAAEIVREGARARAILQRGLGVPVRAFAYPYGDQDQVVAHLIGGCGYIYGLSCVPGRSRIQDSLLVLPRIEVFNSDGHKEFAAKLVT